MQFPMVKKVVIRLDAESNFWLIGAKKTKRGK